ncbi:hypothetical protein PHLGIDRAFT_252881 [Phlebiopsis gigantea 11061_1 CR5-6]|uniref:F-box domain-containing protein n=1 Tax=Phlebiopsis gigantea (strain 11061_1 CR5-6) TaxID=745531 RepID=A0A0C3S1K3_PHLG1|nr:hypothetical protein PHLGIDRAFT_252881 [Phlebiopsis gigantea 11061_1 CR5-6]
MHPCLQIDEILRKIANELSMPTLGGKSQFRDLALTCHTFYEPAMDILWVPFPEAGLEYDQLHLTQPPDILVMARTPLPQEWARFAHHARRITRVSIEHWDVDEESAIHPNCWAAMAEFERLSGTRLFPRVKSLMIGSAQELENACFLFIGPALLTLEGHTSDRATMEQVFGAVRERGTNLQDVEFLHADWSGQDDVQEPFSRALLSPLENLRTLSVPCPDLSPEALVAVAQRPLLETFYCTISAKHAPLLRDPTLPPIFFAALRCLSVSCEPTDLGTLTRFLNELTSPSFLATLQIQCELSPNLSALPNLLIAVSRFENLRGLVLHLHFPASATMTNNPFDSLLDSSALSPLFALHHIRLLSLHGIPIAFWHREGIHDMARAWPHLSHFAFYYWAGRHLSLHQPVMCLSLEELSHFAAHCPMLSRIRVSLQPIPARWTYNRTAALPVSFASRIDWKGSEISADAVGEVSSYLASVFPLARLKDKDWGSRPRTTEEAVTTEIEKVRDRLVSGSLEDIRHRRDEVLTAYSRLKSDPEREWVSLLERESYTFR